MNFDWKPSKIYGNGWLAWEAVGDRGVRYRCVNNNLWAIDYTNNGGTTWQNDCVHLTGTAEEARVRAVAYLIGERISE
jgi:hypothetical protein